MCGIESESQVLASCHFDRSVPPLRISISSYGTPLQFLGSYRHKPQPFCSLHRGNIGDQCSENSDPEWRDTSIDMTEPCSTATSRILLPNEVEAFTGERGGSLAVPRKP